MSTITVTGSTGNIGRYLVAHLLQRGHTVRAVSRPSAKLDAQLAAGAEIYPVDVTQDSAGIARALRGADVGFLMIPPNPTSPDFLAYTDQIAANIDQAVRDSGIQKVVQLSSVGADLDGETGPVRALHRFEKRLRDLQSLDVLVIRPGYFMENLYSVIGMVKGMGVNAGPPKPGVAIPMIATGDVAAAILQRLDTLDFHGHEVQILLGPRNYTMTEATTILGTAIGMPDLKYLSYDYAEAEAGMIGAGLSPGMAGMYIEMMRSVNEHGLFQSEIRTAENTTPTTMEQWGQRAFLPAFQAS